MGIDREWLGEEPHDKYLMLCAFPEDTEIMAEALRELWSEDGLDGVRETCKASMRPLLESAVQAVSGSTTCSTSLSGCRVGGEYFAGWMRRWAAAAALLRQAAGPEGQKTRFVSSAVENGRVLCDGELCGLLGTPGRQRRGAFAREGGAGTGTRVCRSGVGGGFGAHKMAGGRC